MKVTFYGKDFSPIADTKVEVEGLKGDKPLEEIIDIDGCEGLTYRKLLNQFVEDYEVLTKGKKDTLYFSANKDLFGRWVGVFRKKKFKAKEEKTQREFEVEFDITLEISCRFDADKDKDKDKAQDNSAYFLAAMLLCLKPKALEHPYDVNITSFHQVMDIFLLFMYKRQLVEAAKKGIFRKYQRFENNDSRPHGTIDIARHIRENMGLERGSIAYHYRELTANNPVNRLILAAYKLLCEKYPTLCEEHLNQDESVSSTLKMLQTEIGYSKTNVRNIVKENLRPITHPYFSEYEILRKTCLKILRGENVSIFDADCSEETESLYEDVTWLWEQFVEDRIRRLLKEKNYGLFLTTQGIDKRKIPIFAGRMDKYSQPDFILWPEEQRESVIAIRNTRSIDEKRALAKKQQVHAIAILDAKFKPHWDDFFCKRTQKLTEKGAEETIKADTNKCFRDMAVFHARRTGVIFPFLKGEDKDDPPPEKCHKGYPIGISDDMFDMVRVPVSPPEEGTSFKAWYEALDLAVNNALKDYLSDVLGTKLPK